MNFNVVLCENLQLPTSWKCCTSTKRKRPKGDAVTSRVIQDINQLLVDSNFDRNYLCAHILNKLVQLTKSEYGILMQVKYDGENQMELHAHGITNMAWNYASRDFFTRHIDSNLVFKNLERLLFGEILNKQEVRIVNDYPALGRNVLLSGHPPIHRMMGIPIIIGGRPILFLSVCNKLKDYKLEDAQRAEWILSILSYLFIDLDINEFKP